MPSFHLTTHFFNEELLMPYWVKHHLPIFETATLINHRSTDRSVEIIRELAPHWKIVDTTMAEFSAPQLEPEVQKWESEARADYKLTLNTTEFVFNPTFREDVEAVFNHFKTPNMAVGMRSIVMVDKDEMTLGQTPLCLNHTWGYVDGGNNPNMTAPTVRRWRYIHNAEHGHYQLGRHGINLPHVNIESMYLQWFGWAPWKQCIPRKLQINPRIPPHERGILGLEHNVNEVTIHDMYQTHLNKSYNLFEDTDYSRIYNLYLEKYKKGEL